MSRSVILDKSTGKVKRAKASNYPISKIFERFHIFDIIDKPNKLGYVKTADYDSVSIRSNEGSSSVKDVLPFRIRFINIGIPSYGPGNVPPIGIAVIGFSNYIL
jgi:hypothetical protein